MVGAPCSPSCPDLVISTCYNKYIGNTYGFANRYAVMPMKNLLNSFMDKRIYFCLCSFSTVPEKRLVRGTVCQKTEESALDLVFNVEAHSGKELRHFKFLSVSFMGQLLAASSFVGKVSCVFSIKDIMV